MAECPERMRMLVVLKLEVVKWIRAYPCSQARVLCDCGVWHQLALAIVWRWLLDVVTDVFVVRGQKAEAGEEIIGARKTRRWVWRAWNRSGNDMGGW